MMLTQTCTDNWGKNFWLTFLFYYAHNDIFGTLNHWNFFSQLSFFSGCPLVSLQMIAIHQPNGNLYPGKCCNICVLSINTSWYWNILWIICWRKWYHTKCMRWAAPNFNILKNELLHFGKCLNEREKDEGRPYQRQWVETSKKKTT